MRYCLLFSLLCFNFLSCRENSLFEGETRFFKEFEVEAFVAPMDTFEYDSTSYFSLEMMDPLIFMSRYRGDCYLFDCWDIDLKGVIAPFLKRGNGPREYLSVSVLNQLQVYPLLLFQDHIERKIISADLSEIGRGSISFDVIGDYLSVNEDPMQVFYGGHDSIWVKYWTESEGLIYDLRVGGESVKHIPLYKGMKCLDIVNKIMTMADALSWDGSKIVSLSGKLNRIEVLDLRDTKRSFFLTNSGFQLPLADLLEGSSDELMDYYLALPRCDRNLFVVLNNGLSGKSFFFFDWKGCAKIRLNVGEDLRDFLIDWRNKRIIGMDQEDGVYVYSIASYI